MTLRLWRASDEAEFAREARDLEREIEAEDSEWDESRESVLPWQELGGEAT